LFGLSRRAQRDVLRILERSDAQFGPVVADELERRLVAKFQAIGGGVAQGHLRSDVPRSRRLRFEIVEPFAFRPSDRMIMRIVHGARDMRRVFGKRR
jgi:plasmid stabilization system protein ParE